jgi:importin subunit alpha-2
MPSGRRQNPLTSVSPLKHKDSGALPHPTALFSHSKGRIVKEAAWAVSNITAGNQKQIQAVIDAELIPHVVRVLDKGEFKVKKESVWVITNYTSGGSIQQIVYLLNEQVLPPLCAMLKVSDLKVAMVALEAVNNILLNAQRMNELDRVTLKIEECGGLDNIEDLQSHENSKIAQTAYEIIDQYFPQSDTEDVDEVAPAVQEGGEMFQFGVQQAHQAFSL